MSLIRWKILPISFDMHFLHLSFFGDLMRCRYYLAFPVSDKINALALPGCNVRFLVTLFMTTQSSPAGRTRGTGFIGLSGGVLIFAIWFAMRSYHWRRLARVVYRCRFGALWFSAAF